MRNLAVEPTRGMAPIVARRAIPVVVAWLLAVVVTSWLAVMYVGFADPWSITSEHWVITPLSFVVAALANATAVGGGFLFVPVFLLVYELPYLVALKLAFATQAFGMTSGAIGWSRELIDWGALRGALAFGLVGMLIGTLVWTPNVFLVKQVFGWVSLLLAFAVIAEIRGSARRRAWLLPGSAVFAVACFVGGLVNAWISIGIGEVVALLLIFGGQAKSEQAIATGVAALAACSVLGFAVHAVLGGIHWTFLAFTVPGVVVGGWSGARIGRFLESRAQSSGSALRRAPLKMLFVAVVLIDGVVMLVNAYSRG